MNLHIIPPSKDIHLFFDFLHGTYETPSLTGPLGWSIEISQSLWAIMNYHSFTDLNNEQKRGGQWRGLQSEGCGGSRQMRGEECTWWGTGCTLGRPRTRWVAFLHVDIGLVIFSRKEDEKYTCISHQTDTFQPPSAATFILQGRPSFSPVLPSALIPAPPTWPLLMPPCALWDGRQSLSQISKLGWQPTLECAWKRRGKQGESCVSVPVLYVKCLSSLREGGTCTEVCVNTVAITAMAARFGGEIVKWNKSNLYSHRWPSSVSCVCNARSQMNDQVTTLCLSHCPT